MGSEVLWLDRPWSGTAGRIRQQPKLGEHGHVVPGHAELSRFAISLTVNIPAK
jgi:hypothetical protein